MRSEVLNSDLGFALTSYVYYGKPLDFSGLKRSKMGLIFISLTCKIGQSKRNEETNP